MISLAKKFYIELSVLYPRDHDDLTPEAMISYLVSQSLEFYWVSASIELFSDAI